MRASEVVSGERIRRVGGEQSRELLIYPRTRRTCKIRVLRHTHTPGSPKSLAVLNRRRRRPGYPAQRRRDLITGVRDDVVGPLSLYGLASFI